MSSSNLRWYTSRGGTERRAPARSAAIVLIIIAGLRPGIAQSGASIRQIGRQDQRAPWFEDVSRRAGVHFKHVRSVEERYWLPEIMSGGAAWCDLDGDGFQDLYLVQGGNLAGRVSAEAPATISNSFYRNLGNGSFLEMAAQSGLADSKYGMGVTCGDYDGDGDLDVYVTNVGPNVLYRNNGDLTFTDVSDAAGVSDPGWGASTTFLDYDLDGDLDLFVVNYVDWSADREIKCSSGARQRDYCQPENYDSPARDILFRNEGNGRFVDVTAESGLSTSFGNGLGVTVGDFNNDGYPDIYVANDGNPNQLWINRGGHHFENEALIAGVAVNRIGSPEAGMGVAAVDLDSDGDLDIFLTHLRGESNTLYMNRFSTFFDDVTAVSLLAGPSLPFTGFGTGFADFNNDGLLDLYVANGRVGQGLPPIIASDPFAEPNQLFTLSTSGTFSEIPTGSITRDRFIGNSRAIALADYDNDGSIDIAVVNNGGETQLLKSLRGGSRNWVTLQPVDSQNAPLIGFRAELSYSNQVQNRRFQTTFGYCASHDPRLHFGLGESFTSASARLFWPDGTIERYTRIKPRRIYSFPRTPAVPDN